jgi:hypothetical protein
MGVKVAVGEARGTGVQVDHTRVGVGVGELVTVGVGVSVAVGVIVGVGVRLGVGVAVGVRVGVGVIDGVSDGVSEGTSTRTGTSLATARTLLTAKDGWNLLIAAPNHMTTIPPKTTPRITTGTVRSGLNQSLLRGSPQPGQTSKLRVLTLPQYRQRTRLGRSCGLPQ